jgi:cytochrome P450
MIDKIVTDASKTTNQKLKPPLVPGLPFLGNALGMTNDFVGFLVKNYQQFGSIFRVKVPNQSFIILAGVEANNFMSQVGDNYLTLHEIWKSYSQEYGTDIFISRMEGSAHRHLRQIMNRGYSREAILPHLPLLVETTEQMMCQWQIGQRIKVVDAIKQLVVKQLGLTFASYEPDDYFQDLRHFFCTNINVAFKGWSEKALRRPGYLKAKARVMELGQKLIAHHRAVPPINRERNFIDDLLEATDENGQPFSEAALIPQVLSPFLGGMETTANICTFMIFALLNNQPVLERVTAEVNAVLAKYPLSALALREMKSLHGAAMETLRMYPSSPVWPRSARESFEFAGYSVERGEQVMVATTVSHFLPQFFPNPYTFDIDRYHEPRNEHQQPDSYAPFGLGGHICLAKGMTEIQIMTIMATLLRRVRLAIDPPNYKLKTVYNPNPCPKNFWVRVVECH